MATRTVRMNDMVRHGLIMNSIGIVLVTLVCYLLAPVMFGIDLTGGVPDWAATPAAR